MRRSHPALFAGICGFILGCLVALMLAGLNSGPFELPDWLIVMLWPASIFGIGYNGQGAVMTGLLVAALVFGGNGVIYGGVASAIVGAYSGIRSAFDKESRRPISIKPK